MTKPAGLQTSLRRKSTLLRTCSDEQLFRRAKVSAAQVIYLVVSVTAPESNRFLTISAQCGVVSHETFPPCTLAALRGGLLFVSLSCVTPGAADG